MKVSLLVMALAMGGAASAYAAEAKVPSVVVVKITGSTATLIPLNVELNRDADGRVAMGELIEKADAQLAVAETVLTPAAVQPKFQDLPHSLQNAVAAAQSANSEDSILLTSWLVWNIANGQRPFEEGSLTGENGMFTAIGNHVRGYERVSYYPNPGYETYYPYTGGYGYSAGGSSNYYYYY